MSKKNKNPAKHNKITGRTIASFGWKFFVIFFIIAFIAGTTALTIATIFFPTPPKSEQPQTITQEQLQQYIKDNNIQLETTTPTPAK